MVNVRPPSLDDDLHARRRARFNVLLTRDREQNIEHWTLQLPRLMEPLGVDAYVAQTGREALELASAHEIHAALIDLATPADAPAAAGTPGGIWLLEVLARRQYQGHRPPIVVVNTRTYTPGSAQRYLSHALRLGAFSVIDQPSELNQLLAVIQRILERHHRGQWPGSSPDAKNFFSHHPNHPF